MTMSFNERDQTMKVIYINYSSDEIEYEVNEVPFNTFPEYSEYLMEEEDIEEGEEDYGNGVWVDDTSITCIHDEGMWKYEVFKES